MYPTYWVLYVSDLEESYRFYSSLGLNLVPEKHGLGPKHYSLTMGDLIFEIYPAGEKKISHFRVGLVCDENEWDALDIIGNAKKRVIVDPDGNILELRCK